MAKELNEAQVLTVKQAIAPGQSPTTHQRWTTLGAA
jgi:hypothetical protein